MYFGWLTVSDRTVPLPLPLPLPPTPSHCPTNQYTGLIRCCIVQSRDLIHDEMQQTQFVLGNGYHGIHHVHRQPKYTGVWTFVLN